MNTISIRRGETLQIFIEADDESAASVRFLVTKNGTTYLDETESFVNGEATISNDITVAVGDYEYSYIVTYSDGIVDILPDVSDCEECELPVFRVCDSNVEVVS